MPETVNARRRARADAGERKLEQAASKLRRASELRPTLGLVLGSGFGELLRAVDTDTALAYDELPGFLPARVEGHAGRLILGGLGGVPVCVLAGRAHYYEGHSMAALTFPVRVLARFGIQAVLLTNAAGGLRRGFRPGDFMALTDHINFMGENPLRGPAWPGEPRFVDLSAVYDAGLRRLLVQAARTARMRLHRGVYLAVSGPSYETPAEIRAFARWGADAVGMSTVPEAIMARACGLRVAGLSCITNLAAGLSRRAISHAEVLAVARRTGERVARLVGEFARRFAETAPGRPEV